MIRRNLDEIFFVVRVFACFVLAALATLIGQLLIAIFALTLSTIFAQLGTYLFKLARSKKFAAEFTPYFYAVSFFCFLYSVSSVLALLGVLVGLIR